MYNKNSKPVSWNLITNIYWKFHLLWPVSNWNHAIKMFFFVFLFFTLITCLNCVLNTLKKRLKNPIVVLAIKWENNIYRSIPLTPQN